MEFFLPAYYDPFTGSLIIQLVTIGLVTVGVSLHRWKIKLFGFFKKSSLGDENRDE